MVSSTSPLTGKSYNIPESFDDKEYIDKFLLDKKDKKTIVIQGLGFVGSAMSMVVAKNFNKFKVIGVDLPNANNYWKIASFNEGQCPLDASDPKIKDYRKISFENNSFYATYDEYAYSVADVIVIDINLDVQKQNDSDRSLTDYDVNLNPFKMAVKTIGENCKNDVLILLESTVPPGTTSKIVLPILKKEINKRGENFNIKLGHSYERVMPGSKYLDSIENFYRVYSGINEESANAVQVFLSDIIKTDEYPLTRLKSPTETETAKVLENSYRAMNIAFIDEWTKFALNMNINLNEVIKAIKMRPTHNNIMRPGLGVGGYCLTKDPLLASWSSVNLYNGHKLKLSERAVTINDQMPTSSYLLIKKTLNNQIDKKKILFMGVSYLGDVGDTRFTPVEFLFDLLESDGARITVTDPFLTSWPEKDLKINTHMNIENEKFDVVVYCTNHSVYNNDEDLNRVMQTRPKYIFDLNLCLNRNSQKRLSSKTNLITLGNENPFGA